MVTAADLTGPAQHHVPELPDGFWYAAKHRLPGPPPLGHVQGASHREASQSQAIRVRSGRPRGVARWRARSG
jgi:hypothetical protein